MVVSLGPGKFYGSSLPRPRYYTDVKFNDDRVDPPIGVMGPFLSWANEAHWSMGGLNFKRLRLQGRIEGNVDKLRKQLEKKDGSDGGNNAPKVFDEGSDSDSDDYEKGVGSDDSPPPAPVAVKRRRRFVAESDEEEEKEGERGGKKKLARKLNDEFDRVSKEAEAVKGGSEAVGSRRKSRRLVDDEVMNIVEEINKENSEGEEMKAGKKGKSGGAAGSIRKSPRLAKRR